VLTLYTTPVIYLYMEKLARWVAPNREKALENVPAAEHP
jgi:hypothetical protein